MIFNDIDIAEKSLFSFMLSIPHSKEEGNNLSVLRNHPFFMIPVKKIWMKRAANITMAFSL